MLLQPDRHLPRRTVLIFVTRHGLSWRNYNPHAALRILFTTDFAAPPCLLSLFGGILRQTARMSCMASALDFLLSDIANRVEGRQVPDAFALVRGTVMIRYSAVPSIQYLQTSQTTGRLPAPLSIPGICN